VLSGGNGILAPDGKTRYVSLVGRSGTVLSAVLPGSGRIARSKWFEGSLGIPLVAFDGTAGGLTPDGRTLVLGSGPGSGSQFAVLDATTFKLRRLVNLSGQWAYDAISPDGRTLYLIQYVSSGNAIDYRVRAYDLVAGRLVKRVIADKRETGQQMTGSPVSRATAPGGRWIYTLYAKPNALFVHALDAANRAAVCIDLPWHDTDQANFKLRLTLSKDGKQLLVHPRGGQPTVVVDTTSFTARSTSP
jgi:DNA-binding beta-propeller fold protein YncE